MNGKTSADWKPYVALLFMPLFFTSNLIFGRAATSAVEPWTLAFLRWTFAFLLLLPFTGRDILRHAKLLKAQWKTVTLLGLLGMWICGALVYYALHFTTATNATLIYTSSPILILLMEWIFRGRRMGLRESIGVCFAMAGVVLIIVKGSLSVLLGLSFNVGDLIIGFCALSWAGYSVLLKRSVFAQVPTLTLFAVVAGAGALTLFPFMVWEVIAQETFPTSFEAWRSIAGIVIFASLAAFSLFQYDIKTVGPSVTGLFMYLLPPYGVLMAVVFLGEDLQPYHFAGFVLVMGGLILATAPIDLLRRLKTRFAG